MISVNYFGVRVFLCEYFYYFLMDLCITGKNKSSKFYGETGDDVVSEKSEARIRTRKHREKISSFFKFWRPCFMSVYFFIKIFFRKGETLSACHFSASSAQIRTIYPMSACIIPFQIELSCIYHTLRVNRSSTFLSYYNYLLVRFTIA